MSELQWELCSDPLVFTGDSSSPADSLPNISLFLNCLIRERDFLVSVLGVARYTDRIMARQVAVSSDPAQSRAGGVPCRRYQDEKYYWRRENFSYHGVHTGHTGSCTK